MAWLKAGDTAAMDERVLNVAELEDADERSVNEVFGFVMRMFLQAAQQETDYRVSMGTAMVLSPRYEVLLRQATDTGLLSVSIEDGRKVIELVVDPEFMHMRSREELEWERQRKADIANPQLTVPVRLRDGDACRYCGHVVSFGMRKGNRAGTYDHLIPGQRARNENEMVVACQGCNSGRRDAEGTRGDKYVLLPAPPETDRYFSKSTIAWFEGHGTILTQMGLQIPTRPRGAKDRRPGTQTRSDVQPMSHGTDGAANAATASSGDQRPAPSQTRPDDAAPHTSGDQRSASAREGNAGDDQRGYQRAVRTFEASATAAPHTSGDQRAEVASDVRTADAGSIQVASQRTSKPGMTSGNTRSADPAERQGPGSGFPGTGRDGSGRDGLVRNGTARGAGPRPQGAGPPGDGSARKRKRGRRRRGKR